MSQLTPKHTTIIKIIFQNQGKGQQIILIKKCYVLILLTQKRNFVGIYITVVIKIFACQQNTCVFKDVDNNLFIYFLFGGSIKKKCRKYNRYNLIKSLSSAKLIIF